MPLVSKCFDCGVQVIQFQALKKTETIIKDLVDYNYTKAKLLPKVLNLCTASQNELKKRSIVCLSKIYHLIDKTT